VRSKVYGRNLLPEVKPVTIFELMWQAFQDKILILLSFAALISLAIGLYQGKERYYICFFFISSLPCHIKSFVPFYLLHFSLIVDFIDGIDRLWPKP
jgi:magnesium-transporting ATPase (P-type)